MSRTTIVPEAYTGRIRSTGPVLVLFDLDRTLLPGSSLVLLARRFARAGLLSRRTIAGALARQAFYRCRGASADTAERACRQALTLVAGVAAQVAAEITA